VIRLCWALICLLAAGGAYALPLDLAQGQLHNLEKDSSGFIKNVNGDGYITFRQLELTREQVCGIEMDVEFKRAMARPGIFEIFWHASGEGFTEGKKAFVIINHRDSAERKTYVIPLCKLFHFSGNINQAARQGLIAGLRFDYPANRTSEIKFHSIRTLNGGELMTLIEQADPHIKLLEPYERIRAKSFTSLDVILPKLYFSFEQGFKRLSYDKVFTFSWLAMMFALLALIVRSVLRKAQ